MVLWSSNRLFTISSMSSTVSFADVVIWPRIPLAKFTTGILYVYCIVKRENAEPATSTLVGHSITLVMCSRIVDSILLFSEDHKKKLWKKNCWLEKLYFSQHMNIMLPHFISITHHLNPLLILEQPGKQMIPCLLLICIRVQDWKLFFEVLLH